MEGNLAFVTLTKGYEAVIDAADVPLVDGQNWTAAVDGRTVYAYRMVRRADNKQRMSYMHRVIFSASSGTVVDHIDGDGLNNRRLNLRSADHSQNAINKKRALTSSSGLKGATFNRKRQMWKATIGFRGQSFHLGYHYSKEAAHSAYAKASAILHGEFGRIG